MTPQGILVAPNGAYWAYTPRGVPPADIDGSTPITGRRIASCTGLSVLRGNPDVDLRTSFFVASSSVVVGGKRGDHDVQIVHRRLGPSLAGRRADEQFVSVRAAFAIPAFEVTASDVGAHPAPISDLGVVDQMEDDESGRTLALRAAPHDARALRALFPLFAELLRIPYARVHSDGRNVVFSTTTPWTDVFLGFANYVVTRLVRVIEQLERGTSDGPTLAMTALRPASRWELHPEWACCIARPKTPGDGAGCASIVLVVLSIAMAFRDVHALSMLPFGLFILAAAAFSNWEKAKERLEPYEHGFVWHRAWRKPRTILYADVVSHHRAETGRTGMPPARAELLVVLPTEKLRLDVPAAGRLALLLDEQEVQMAIDATRHRA